ncbi:QueT transporter family protein, partial [Enterococcus faecium]
VTAGVALAKMATPLGLIFVAVASFSTLLVLVINYKITSRNKNMKIKMAVTASVFAFTMFTVAGQLTILYQLPIFKIW